MQMIEAIAEICRQLAENAPQVNSVYQAAVSNRGNTTAQKIIDDHFDIVDAYWRGVGKIKKSGLALKQKYSRYDAAKRFDIDTKPSEVKTGCRCGEVLCGLIEPPQCKMFAAACTPDEPVGPCMVSSEGTCAAWYKYARKTNSK